MTMSLSPEDHGLFFRTDSETTDDHDCIPESTSEPHDSALDSMDDFIDDDNIRISVHKKVAKAEDLAPKVPQICLLEVQSSTESDKTVLSTTTVFEQQLRAINSDCSLPSSPGLICAASGDRGFVPKKLTPFLSYICACQMSLLRFYYSSTLFPLL